MKTTISVPEHLSRTTDDLAARLNAIYGKPGTISALGPELAALQAITLARVPD